MIKSWRMCVATRVLYVRVCEYVCGGCVFVCKLNKSTVRQMPVKFWQVSVVTVENCPSSTLCSLSLSLSPFLLLPLQRRN